MENVALTQQIEHLAHHVQTLQQRLRVHPAYKELAVDDLFETLHSAVQELQVANVELGQQSEAVAYAEAASVHQQTVAQLRASEALWRLFVEQVPAAVALFDRTMRYLAVSRRWMQDYGLHDTIIGRSHYEVFPELPEHWKAVHRRCLEGAREHRSEDRFERADGPVQWLHWAVCPWYDSADAVGGIMIFSEDITARKQLAETSHSSAERYRALAEAVPGLIWTRRSDGVATYLNQRWTTYTGQPLEQALELGWAEMLHPDDAPGALAAFQQAVQTGSPYTGEARYRRHDGVYRWFLEQAVPIRDAHGTIVEWVGIALDIEEEKRQQAALTARIRQIEAVRAITTEVARELHLPTLLRLIVEHAVTLLGASHGVIHEWDERTQRLIPQAWTDSQASSLFQVMRLSLGQGVAGYAAQIRQRVVLSDYHQTSHAHPPLRGYGVRAALAEPLFDRDHLLGVMVLYHTGEGHFDIEQDDASWSFFASQAVVALRHAQLLADAQDQARRLQTVIETAVDAILIIDEHGTVEMCNPAIASLLGYHPSQVIGHNVNQLMPAPDRQAHDGYLDHYLRTGERRIIGIGREVMGQRPDGTLVPLRLSVSEIALGAQRRFVGILHDITPYKQAEAALQHAHDELEARVQERTAALQNANADIRRFAFIVSHDLRAPLTNIRGFARELQDACTLLRTTFPAVLDHLDPAQRSEVTRALEEDIPEALDFITTSMTRMGSLIDTILRLARVGRQELHLEPIATAELVHETLATLAHQIAQRRVHVTVGALPVVYADRTALEQIFGNLLANAVAYLEPGRLGVLSITATQQADVTVLQVQDNGRGIATDDIPHIFEPFRRVGRQDVPGEGMGLAYVQRLVQRHGGTITCQSTLGVGTQMTFTIPHQHS